MKRVLQVVVGVAISALALWLTLRGKDIGGIWQEMQVADYRYLIPYLLTLAAIHFARTVRWGILLEPVAKVPFARLNAVSAVGFMALVLLPFRLGEFARPYLVAERPRLRVSAALSSVVVERVVDGIFMGVLLLVTLLAAPARDPRLIGWLRWGGVIVSAAFAGLLAFLVLAYRSRALAVRIVGRLVGPVSPRLAARAAGMMDAFIHGLRLVPSRRKLLAFFGLTAAYWALNAWGMSILARGFGLELSLIDSCTVLGVLVVGVMIPAGPGMVGTFQGAIGLGLSVFFAADVVGTRGLAFANVLWAAQIAQQTAFGVFFLFSRHIQLGRVFASPESVEEGLEDEEQEYREDEPALPEAEREYPARGQGRAGRAG